MFGGLRRLRLRRRREAEQNVGATRGPRGDIRRRYAGAMTDGIAFAAGRLALGPRHHGLRASWRLAALCSATHPSVTSIGAQRFWLGRGTGRSRASDDVRHAIVLFGFAPQ